MAKQIFENARVTEVYESEKEGYKNTELRITELGKSRGVLTSVKIKPEQADNFRKFCGHVLPQVVALAFDKSGVSSKGKPYAFTELVLDSFQPPASAQKAA